MFSKKISIHVVLYKILHASALNLIHFSKYISFKQTLKYRQHEATPQIG